MGRSLTEQEWEDTRKNLFPRAAAWVSSQEAFPWHRDRKGAVTAPLTHSSQALALDVFATVAKLECSSEVVAAWTAALDIGALGPVEISPEYTLPAQALGEPRSTQVDVQIRGEGGLLFLECKFTERDGGACSQTRPLRTGSNKGKVQCTGDYSLQVNPVNGITSRCAISGKKIRYWDQVPRTLGIPNDQDLRPCPFRGGWYQWMRNVVGCAVAAEKAACRGNFILVYADGPFPVAEKVQTSEWRDFVSAAQDGAVAVRAVSYQELLNLAEDAAVGEEVKVLCDLQKWVIQKIDKVASGCE